MIQRNPTAPAAVVTGPLHQEFASTRGTIIIWTSSGLKFDLMSQASGLLPM